jgi:dTMP kinase
LARTGVVTRGAERRGPGDRALLLSTEGRDGIRAEAAAFAAARSDHVERLIRPALAANGCL